MEEAGGSIASERSLSLSEDTAEESASVWFGVASLPFVNARSEGVEDVGRYITVARR